MIPHPKEVALNIPGGIVVSQFDRVVMMLPTWSIQEAPAQCLRLHSTVANQ
jgi:hypothetical protein